MAEGSYTSVRRYTLRLDGFVSAQAPLSGGELITRPLRVDGSRLEINFSTSATGTVRIELQGADGNPIPGYSLADCDPQFGDQLDRVVSWRSGTDVSPLTGRPVRMRIQLQDANLYSFRFLRKQP